MAAVLTITSTASTPQALEWPVGGGRWLQREWYFQTYGDLSAIASAGTLLRTCSCHL